MYGAATVWLGHSVEPPLSAARHSRRFVGNLENYPTGLGPSLTTEQTGNCRTIPSHQETPESARHRAGSRQTLPWDYFTFARDSGAIDSATCPIRGLPRGLRQVDVNYFATDSSGIASKHFGTITFVFGEAATISCTNDCKASRLGCCEALYPEVFSSVSA